MTTAAETHELYLYWSVFLQKWQIRCTGCHHQTEWFDRLEDAKDRLDLYREIGLVEDS